MFRIKDLYMKNIYDIKGKKIGLSKEIYIDFYKGEVIGIGIGSYSIRNRNNYVSTTEIINVDNNILIKKAFKKDFKVDKGLKFSDINDMDVIDRSGNPKGLVEDILIDEESFHIKGLIISSGIIDKILSGREVILMNNAILGEDKILYSGASGVVLKNIPHHRVNHEYYKKA